MTIRSHPPDPDKSDHGSQPDREIVVERLIRAPRHLVWKAFMEPGHVEQWWGPNGFTTTTHERDFTPGGTWRFTMHGPDGRDFENHVLFDEVVEPERVTYRHGGGGATSELRFVASIRFEERDGGTLVTIHSVFPTAEMRDLVVREYGAIEGGKQTLARLAALTEGRTR